MAVYVDPLFPWPRQPRWPYGAVSTLYADTPEELHSFALLIGLKRRWCSDVARPGSQLLHYDLSPGMRTVAVRNGAVEAPPEHKRGFDRAPARDTPAGEERAP